MITRRKFLKGGAAFTAIAGTGISLGWSPRAMGGTNNNTLVYLFCRGGMDSLNFLVPLSGTNRSEYESKRPSIQVPIGTSHNLDGSFGLHPACGDLYNLYQANNLAMIHAVGMPAGLGSRSHFDSMEMYELGTPGNMGTLDGWLARHINSAPNIPPGAVVPSMTPGNPPTSMLGDYGVMSLDDPSGFHPNSGRYQEEHMEALAEIYSGTTPLDLAVQGAVDTIDVITGLNLDIPASYPNTGLADDLGLIAQVIKSDVGLQVATVDFGGWDTHGSEGNNGGGYFSDHIGEVSEAVGAFFDDLQSAGKMNQVVLALQSEFGRRVRQNGNEGTDHGTAHAMMVVGGAVQGGRVLGTFPGIADSDLYLNTDLAVTTDFRQPLSEIVYNFMGNPNTDIVFPGYTGSTNMGMFPSEHIFDNGFE